MYKLPWIIHVNDRKFPLWIRQKGQSYQFYANFREGSEDDHGLIINNDSIKIKLGIGTMMVDEEFNVVSGTDTAATLTIFLTMASKQVELYGEKLLMVESNGV